MTRIIWFLLAAATLAALGACGATPAGSARGTPSLQQLAQGVVRGEDWVSVEQLARWIVSGRRDFVLIDIRPATEFDSGHIQGAQNLSLPQLLTESQLAALPPARKLVIVSADSAEAAAAVVLVRLAKREAVAVRGGYTTWGREILHPQIPAVATVHEPPAQAQQRALACYFASASGAASKAPVYTPKAAQPFSPTVTPQKPTRPRRQSSEGC